MIKNNGLMLLLVLFSCTCYSQQIGCFIETADHEIELDTKTDFSRYKGFFVGEVHKDGRQGMKLALLKYLNKQFGITDVFMEFSYSTAYLYNKYLATGDLDFINLRFIKFNKTKEDKLFWKDLYKYNKTLNKKIVIHGMDAEDTRFAKTLYLLMPAGKEKPAAISKTLSYIQKKGSKKHYFLAYPNYSRVKKEVSENVALYEQYYGENYNTVADIMFNVDNWDTANANRKKYGPRNGFSSVIFRDSTMCINVQKQIDQYSIKKYVVFVGLMHTYKARKNSLFTNMTKQANSKDSLANIALTFKNTKINAKYKNKYRFLIASDNNDKPISYDTNYSILDKTYEKYYNKGCKYTLVNANTINDNSVDTVIKNYADYLIMMEGKW